ncbi:MAG: sensor histidine kinase, partial [Polyangia bacterium]
PLNAASLQLLVLERRLKRLPNLPDDLFEPLAIVQSEIKRLASFLDDFLQFARPRDLTLTTVDVAQLIRYVVELLRPQAAAAKLRIDVQAGELPKLSVDEAKVRQSLVNLVLNAIQATPPGGSVRVIANVEESDLSICVDDDGPGVAPELRNRIFEPFFTTKDAGTGLGLPLVHSIVQQHGGTIAIESSPSGGARFHIRLPLQSRK